LQLSIGQAFKQLKINSVAFSNEEGFIYIPVMKKAKYIINPT